MFLDSASILLVSGFRTSIFCHLLHFLKLLPEDATSPYLHPLHPLHCVMCNLVMCTLEIADLSIADMFDIVA